ncbi:MAG: hypothetical protein LUC95_11020 [Lachnospiraceae bacterium]|nr:hypothetical protein [Lachnospiraceae bacterium]
MIYDEIDFHNVEEMMKTESGWRLSRLPLHTAQRLDEKIRGSRLIYTPGKELLSQPEYISADMTHPTLEGQLMVAQRWSSVMKLKGALR